MDNSLSMELATYRLGQAADCLQAAENNLASELYKDALNRSYYCIFHSIRAVLALDMFDAKSTPALYPNSISATSKAEYLKSDFPI